MVDLVTIVGSPSPISRSAFVAERAGRFAGELGCSTETITLRNLNASDLFTGNRDSSEIRASVAFVARARAVIVSTPVYKAAYTGLLKAFLDVLPQDILREKVVLPIATGGSPVHFLAIDYALRPVLAALGAQHFVGGVYVVDSQIGQSSEGLVSLDPDIDRRLQASVGDLVRAIGRSQPTAVTA